MGYVRARSNFVTTVTGKRTWVRRSDLPRRDNDPIVKKLPAFFVPVEDVEDATAEPGRKRGRTRPAKATQPPAPANQDEGGETKDADVTKDAESSPAKEPAKAAAPATSAKPAEKK